MLDRLRLCAEQVSLSALAGRRAETSLTAQALRTLTLAGTGGQTRAEEPFGSPRLWNPILPKGEFCSAGEGRRQRR